MSYNLSQGPEMSDVVYGHREEFNTLGFYRDLERFTRDTRFGGEQLLVTRSHTGLFSDLLYPVLSCINLFMTSSVITQSSI